MSTEVKAQNDMNLASVKAIYDAAKEANDILDDMKDAAEEAGTTLTQIYQDAEDAADAASEAKEAADLSLVQLSVVQDVAGTLDWIQKHGTFTVTSDTTVQEGTVYFIKEGNDYTPIAQPDPTANPHNEGWYVLDITDSQSEFIMAHLAVTTRGLWVLPSGINTGSVTPASGEAMDDARARLGSNYKVLLSNDGMYIYDGTGALIAKYGADIDFSSSRRWHVGSNEAYILYDPTTHTINIGGSVVFDSDKTMTELIAALNEPVLDITSAYTSSGVTLTASVRRGGEDVTSEYLPSTFEWYFSKPDGLEYIGICDSNYQIAIAQEDLYDGQTVMCEWARKEDAGLLDHNSNLLTDSSGNILTGYTEV